MINTISKIKKLELVKTSLNKKFLFRHSNANRHDNDSNLSDETLESLKQFKNKEFDVYTS